MSDSKVVIQRRYRKKNLAKVRLSQRKSKLKKLYGLTIEDYEQMLRNQSRQCFLCKKKLKKGDINIDHDHMTNKVRKILCTYCNIRMASVDSEEWLDKAIIYRDSHRKENN